MQLKAASPLGGAPTNTNSKPSGQSTIIWVAAQVHIGVGGERVWDCPLRVYQLHVSSTLEIPEDPFCHVPVVHPRVLNEVAEYTHNVCYVQVSSNGQIEQLTNEFSIGVGPHLCLAFRSVWQHLDRE